MKQNDPVLSLEIAGLGISAVLDPPDLIGILQKRYAEFPRSISPQLQIEIRITGHAHASSLQDAGMNFQQGELRFGAPGYEGFIREREGVGRLQLSTRQPVEDIEYFLRVAFALLAFQAGGILLHAAGIARAGRAYLFFGPSGSGKTTISRLSNQDVVLNDDLIILMPSDLAASSPATAAVPTAAPTAESGWQVFGTPFWNPTQVRPTSRQAPLAGLFSLVQDRQVYLEEISPSEALAELVANTPVLPADPGRTPKLIERLKEITAAAPIHRLHFLPDLSFWDIILKSSRHDRDMIET